MILYLKYLTLCIEIADKEYRGIGFVKEENTYKWIPIINTPHKIQEKYSEYQSRFLIRNFGDNFDDMIKYIEKGEGDWV